MSDYDDHDYGWDIQQERDADYEREIAIADHLSDRERDDEDRARRDRQGNDG
jgi:hypothetical protein